MSTFSSTSVSTISTTRSRSPSPRRRIPARTMQQHHSRSGLQDSKPHTNRRSSSISAKSYTSTSSLGRERESSSHYETKGIGRQPLPNSSKARENRLGTAHGTNIPGRVTLKRRRSSQSSPRSYSSTSSTERRRRHRSRDGDRNTRRRHSSISPDRRGRDRSIPALRHKRRTQSRSRDRSWIARNRQSMTPASPHTRESMNGRAYQSGPRGQPREPDSAAQVNDRKSDWRAGNNNGNGISRPPYRKDRSLSPFSKRLALTQAMNMGVR